MKIGIVLHPYGEDKPGGLARTILEWSSGLLRNAPQNEYVIFLKNRPKILPDLPGDNWKMEVLGGGIFWLNRLRSVSLVDVYLFQTPVLPLIFKPQKSIIIAQDFPYLYLRPSNLLIRLRNIFIYSYHLFSLRKADAVVAVSNSTKDDLKRFFKIPEEKIHVIYMGFKKICEAPEVIIDLPDRFFLFVGVIKERKNVLNIVEAFRIFKEAHPASPYKLALAGKTEGQYFEKVKRRLEEIKLLDDVLFLGYLNDDRLSFAYKKAAALIFPSVVEGFGFPVLEAMDCGLPVITSNIFGPAEIGNGAAILVDPASPLKIKEAMEKIAFNENFRRELVGRGFKRSREFSWDKSARELFKVIENI